MTHTNWSPTTQDLVQGLGGNADYMAVGTRIDWRILELGLVYSHQNDGDMVQVPIGDVNTPVAFDADGVELFARAGLGTIGLIGGFTYQEPDAKDPLLDPDFKTAVSDPGRRVVCCPDRQDLHGKQDRSRQRDGDRRIR